MSASSKQMSVSNKSWSLLHAPQLAQAVVKVEQVNVNNNKPVNNSKVEPIVAAIDPKVEPVATNNMAIVAVNLINHSSNNKPFLLSLSRSQVHFSLNLSVLVHLAVTENLINLF